MSGLRQILLGILAVSLSGLIIFGALNLSSTERGQETAEAPSQTLQATPMVSQEVTQQPTASSTIPPLPSDDYPLTDETNAPTKGITPTQPPAESTSETQVDVPTATPAEAEITENDVYYSMFPGVFKEDIHQASIIIIQEEAGPTPTVTEQATSTKSKSCSKPRGWVAYTIRRGDTLSRLSQLTGVSASKIKKANCLGSNKLKPGKTIYLPPVNIAPQMWQPMPPPMQPPLYYNPARKPQSAEQIRPVVIITMPP